MARKEDMNDEKFGVFALNEISVGSGGNNKRRADVQLIQFFLRQFFKNHPELFVRLPKTKSNFITIDGICGGQTEMGILLFQRHQKKGGSAIVADGRVNVATGLNIPNITATPFTIHHLNNNFKLFGDGREHHGNIQNHPDILNFAPELFQELSRARVEDRF